MKSKKLLNQSGSSLTRESYRGERCSNELSRKCHQENERIICRRLQAKMPLVRTQRLIANFQRSYSQVRSDPGIMAYRRKMQLSPSRAFLLISWTFPSNLIPGGMS
jgi:hypothetical protein